MRRILMTVAVALLWVATGLSQPASAHSVAGISGTNFLTTIKGVSPAIPGLTVRPVEAGSRIELVNETGRGPSS